MGWDEPLSAKHQQDWQAWTTESLDVSQIHIERCLQPSGFGDIAAAELHHFSDALTLAYGPGSYIRLVTKSGEIKCSLLHARSRVVPLKSVTIPRLELAAATLSVQQDEMLRRELSIQVDSSTFYTESSLVLAYIRNKRRMFSYLRGQQAGHHSLWLNAEPVEIHSVGDKPSRWSLKKTACETSLAARGGSRDPPSCHRLHCQMEQRCQKLASSTI